MNTTKFFLSELVLLDGYCHEGDLLAGRIVVQYILSCTIGEIFDPLLAKPSPAFYPLHNFEYIDMDGDRYGRTLAIHFSLAEDSQIDHIIDKIIKWYSNYMRWNELGLAKQS